MALGSLIIQTKYSYSNKELVDQLTKNPYYQYFIGFLGYQKAAPFEASVLVAFRKRINAEMLIEVNECLLENTKQEKDDNNDPKQGSSSSSNHQKIIDEETNSGTLIVDATCVPSNIRYPQDFSLLNETREKLEKMIDRFCTDYSLLKPRMYRRKARKNYLTLAKTKKRSKNKIKQTIVILYKLKYL